jgi:catechol 2,3-dioxygenase-like lactoylglutathione lyase family enzyme
MIGRLTTFVIDCPDPKALADFYSAVTGLAVIRVDADGWVTLGDAADPDRPHVAFQPAPDHLPPQWPDPRYPQQMHLDVQVDDIDVAHDQVLALGARHVPPDLPGFRVYLDPAGHPFCLVYG